MSSTERQRHELVERFTPLVAELGFDLDDVVVSRIGQRVQVRVTIDSDDGIGIDDIALVSRALDADLDRRDPFTAAFVLEVSSPGIDRPLTTATHWRRNQGRLVRVEHAGTSVTGRVLAVSDPAAEDAQVTLEVNGARLDYPLRSLGPGRVQVEFNRPADADAGDEANLSDDADDTDGADDTDDTDGTDRPHEPTRPEQER